MMELVAATAIFITSIGLLAGTTTTALSTRVSLSRAAAIDSVLNRLLNTAASSNWESLLANTFTPPTPLCDPASSEAETDAEGSGSLSRTCALVNGRQIEVAWSIRPIVSDAGADGIPQGAADALVLTASTTRADGSTASRSITLNAPMSGYRVATNGASADAVVRVQLSGSWQTLDSPLLLLSPGADGLYNDNADVLAAATIDDAGAAVFRVGADQAVLDAKCPPNAELGCRVALGLGLNRGMTQTHSLDAGSLLGAGGKITLTAGKSTYASARVYRRGVLDVYLQARNTFGGRRLASVLSNSPVTNQSTYAPQAGSVCMWASFSDGYSGVDQEVPECNFTDRYPVVSTSVACVAYQAVALSTVPASCIVRDPARAITFETYQPDSTEYPGLELAIPTDEIIKLSADSTKAGCPAIPGQRFTTTAGGVSTWNIVTTTGVCSSWTWGRPTTLTVFGQGNQESTFPNATVTIAGGGHTVATATWFGDAGRPAAGVPSFSDTVWSKPRDAALCGWPGTCVSPATAPETTECPNTACKSTMNAAPYVQLITPNGGASQGWPLAMVVASGASRAFTTSIADPEGGQVTVTVQNAPAASYGTLSLCTPACSPVVVGASFTIASGSTTSWSWTSGVTGASPSAELKLTDAQGNTRYEYLQFPKISGTPTAVAAMRTVAAQGGSDSNRATVWDEVGGGVGSATVTWNSCLSYSSSAGATTEANGNATSTWSVTGSQARTVGALSEAGTELLNTLGQCSVSVQKNSATYSVTGAFSRTVRQAPGEITVVLGTSTQNAPAVVSVVVKDRTTGAGGGNLLAGWPVALLAENTAGEPAQSVWSQVPWCLTGAAGSCNSTFSVGTDTTASSWVLRAKSGSAVATQSSSITRIASRITGTSARLRVGATAEVTITTADGAGVPVGNMPITISVPAGVSVSPAVATTDSKGSTTVTLTAAATATIGKASMTVTSGATVRQVPFVVDPAPQTLQLSQTNITVTRSAAPVGVTATVTGGREANGSAAVVPDVTVVVEGGDEGVRVSPRVSTDDAGQAVVKVYAEPDAEAGVRTITVSITTLSGTVSRTFTVGVQ